jgi:PKD repeat protein
MRHFLRSTFPLLLSSILFLGGLPGCSREEPELPGEPIVVRKQAAPAGGSGEPIQPLAKPAPEPEVKDTGPGALTAFADVDQSVGTVPHTVRVNVDVIEHTGQPPYTYTWDFGDATAFSNEKSPTHVYEVPGEFRASVLVRDKSGQVEQDYIDVSVLAADRPSEDQVRALMERKPLQPYLDAAQGAASGSQSPEEAGH